MPAAVVKGSSSRWMRVLAALLTSKFFLLASCTGSMSLITAYGGKETRIDAATPARLPIPYGVAVIATIDPRSPKDRQVVTIFVKEPLRDLAMFRTEHSSYSLVPMADRGAVVFDKGGEFPYIDIDYQVSKRESGKAVVKTHYHANIPIIGPQNVSATYEATDSDIRLISYKANPFWIPVLLGAMIFTLLLSIVGQILKPRFVTSPDPNSEAERWKVQDNAWGSSGMNTPAPQITIRYPRIAGIIGLVFGLPIYLVLDLLAAALLVMIVPPMWAALGAVGTLGAAGIVTVYLLFATLVVAFSWYIWFIVRNTESLFSTFRVSRTEITIENSRYGVLTLNWEEVARATFRKLGFAGRVITLEAPQLAKPLAIMSRFRTPGSNAKFVIAQMVIQRAMGDRWIERWL